MTKKLYSSGTCAVAALGAVLLAGCHLGEPSSASFASVKIKNHSVQDIRGATVAVFQEDGYRASAGPGSTMVFEKEASRMSDFAYGGVVNTYYGAQTIVRVKADVVDIGAGSQRLQCRAYVVKDANDAFFQEEQPLANVRSRPYQNLLDKVADRLK